MNDIFGKALLDYFHGEYTEDIITWTSISEEDELPIPYLFRNFDEMPILEQKALQLCDGKILDAGCGAGSHSLYLQEEGFEVIAIDTSRGAVEVSKKRGVDKALVQDLLNAKGSYDTVILLMNGTGIFKTVAQTPVYLKKLKSLLNPKGSILIDSSDLRYMYDSDKEGRILVPGDRYYGELDYYISYKGESSDAFPLLYLDEGLFASLCEDAGLDFEVVARGENYNYLARITG